MKYFLRVCLIFGVVIMADGRAFSEQFGNPPVEFIVQSHASFVIISGTAAVYVDPTGEKEDYTGIPDPDIILVTHGHFDHLNKSLIAELERPETVIIGPGAVISDLCYGEAFNNSESQAFGNIGIQAVPAYNITPDRIRSHPKETGNGYVVTLNGLRIYISGDTEDTPEMRNLKDIDYAFVCMNLPWTMSVEQAASGVLAFKPKVVFPYHYRQRGKPADLEKFKRLVSRNKNIKVELLKWYK